MRGTKTRWISLALSICLILSLLPTTAWAAEEQEPDAQPAQTADTLSPDAEVHSVNTLTSAGAETGTQPCDGTHGSGWTVLPAETMNGENITLGPGKYYLANSVSLQYDPGVDLCQITISGDVTLCLNGHTLDLGGHNFVLESGSTFTLCDCSNSDGSGTGTLTSTDVDHLVKVQSSSTFHMYGGTIRGGSVGVYGGNFYMYHGSITGSSRTLGGGVYVDDNGSFTMNGGTISGNTATSSGNGGGGVAVSGGSFTMNGGSITGNTATNNGGGVYVAASSTFTMNGGSISGNTATGEYRGGGGVYVNSSGSFIMTGGSISGNEATIGGGGVYSYGGSIAMSGGSITGNTADQGGGVYAYCRMSVSGSASVTGNHAAGDVDSNVYLAGSYKFNCSTSSFTDDANIGVSMENPGVFTTGGGAAYQQYFFSDDVGYAVLVDGNELKLGTPPPHSHAVCGASCSHNPAHSNSAEWQAWTPTDSGDTLTGGSYYLTDNVSLSGDGSQIKITGEVNLCLNGHTITGSANYGIFRIGANGVLNICDCSANQAGIIQENGDHNPIFLHSGGVCNLYSGTIRSGITAVVISANTVSGGSFEGGTENAQGGTFDQYGGTVESTSDAKQGIYVYAGLTEASVSLYGGTVRGNYAVNAGSGTVTLSGSPDLAGTAADIHLENSAKIRPDSGLSGSFSVHMENPGVFTDGNMADFMDNFTSANDGYQVAQNSSGALMLHQHSYTYQVTDGGNTITESCTCGHRATATISAPSNLTYDGQAKTASVAYSGDPWKGGSLTITYQKDVAPLGAAPTEAGTYTAAIQKDDATARVSFTIAPKAYSESDFTITDIPQQDYTGDEIKPSVTVTANGEPLTLDVDYTLTYGDNIGKGTATVTITFQGNYSGTAEKTFEIDYADLPDGVSNEAVFPGYGTVSGSWSNSDSVTFTPADGWTVSTEPDGEYKESVTFDDEQDGEHTETVYVKDDDGNIYETEITYKPDKTQPVVSEPQAPGSTAWTKDDVTVSFTASDTTSQVASVTVSRDGTEVETFTGDGSSYTFDADQNGTYVITVTDNAGNETTQAITIDKIDKVEPTVSISGGDTGDTDLTLTIDASDGEQSGVAGITVSGPGSPTVTDDNTFTVTESGTYTITVTDNAGNQAQKTLTVHSVTIDGTVQLVKDGGTATPPTAPEKTGYTFDGWYQDGSDTKWNFASDRVTSDITLYAKWTPNSNTAYTVNHWQQNLNGGSEQNDTNYTRKDTDRLTGTTAAQVTPAVKTYEGFTAPATETVTIAADGSTVVNYYYARNSYEVALEKGTGIGTVTGVGTYQYGASVTIGAEVSPGYAWKQWSDGDANQSRTFSMGAQNITLTAQAEVIVYGITYDLDGGAAAGNPTSYTVETASFTLENPTRTGFTFAGWTGTGLTDASDTVTIPKGSTGDRSYTATWTANNYAITYNLNGGALSEPVTSYTYGTGATLPVPVKAGYTFGGWYAHADFSGSAATEITATDIGAKVFYAKWTLDVPTVALCASAEHVTYGDTIILTATVGHGASVRYTYEWYKGDTKLDDVTGETLTLSTVAHSGTYKVVVTATDNDGQMASKTSDSITVSIAKKSITGTWTDIQQVYDDDGAAAILPDGLETGDSDVEISYHYTGIDGTVYDSDEPPTAAGTYTITATMDDYTLTNATTTLVIQKKPVVVTVTNNGVTTGGKPNVNVPGLTENSGYTVSYQDEDGNEVTDLSKPGTYEVWVEFTDPNYRHPDGSTAAPVGSVTVAQTQPPQYTVSFDGTMTSLELAGGSILTLPECTCEKDGAQFTGWLYNGKVYQPGDRVTTVYGDMTFTPQWQETFTVTGTVKEEMAEPGVTSPVENAVVSLWLGANKLAETHTDSSGEYTFSGLLPGIYNLVASKDQRTVTTMVEISTEDRTCNAVLPQYITNSVVEVTPGSPDIVVGNLDNAFTEADLENAKNNSKVEITFKADKQETAEGAELEKLQSAGGSNLSLFLNCTLTKTVTNQTGTSTTPLTQSSVLLEVRLPLPTELQGKYGYTVSRIHEGEAQSLTTTANGLGEYFEVSEDKTALILHVKCFSTYAVGYQNPPSSATTYPPTKAESENGAFTLSPSRPTRGQTVTITPKPDAGYEVAAVTVTDRNGDVIDVTPKADGTYTFIQPNGSVTVTVTFREVNNASDCPRDDTCPMAAFTDVDLHAWYHDGVHYCVEYGLMSGYGHGVFGPNNSLSRGMLVQILYNLEGRPATSGKGMFEDVPDGAWYSDAVNWAASRGIVGGYGNGMYGPEDSITREQLAAILYRYAQYKEYDVSVGEDTNILSYTDAMEISEYAVPAMQWACGAGIIGGVTTSTLLPEGTATRAQVATMLMRFADKVAQ